MDKLQKKRIRRVAKFENSLFNKQLNEQSLTQTKIISSVYDDLSKKMKERSQSTDDQYLNQQQRMQTDNRKFSRLEEVMKKRRKNERNSINNIP